MLPKNLCDGFDRASNQIEEKPIGLSFSWACNPFFHRQERSNCWRSWPIPKQFEGPSGRFKFLWWKGQKGKLVIKDNSSDLVHPAASYTSIHCPFAQRFWSFLLTASDGQQPYQSIFQFFLSIIFIGHPSKSEKQTLWLNLARTFIWTKSSYDTFF